MNGWTLERRQKQSQLIQDWRPWGKSAGPKSEEGKQKVSQHAGKHGMRPEEIESLEKLLSEQ